MTRILPNEFVQRRSKAIQRLHTVITRLRDAILVVQRDAFAAFSDREAFDNVKRRAVIEIDEIANTFEA